MDTTSFVASRMPLLRLEMRHVPPYVQKTCQGHEPRRTRFTDTISSPEAHIVPCCDNVSALAMPRQLGMDPMLGHMFLTAAWLEAGPHGGNREAHRERAPWLAGGVYTRNG